MKKFLLLALSCTSITVGAAQAATYTSQEETLLGILSSLLDKSKTKNWTLIFKSLSEDEKDKLGLKKITKVIALFKRQLDGEQPTPELRKKLTALSQLASTIKSWAEENKENITINNDLVAIFPDLKQYEGKTLHLLIDRPLSLEELRVQLQELNTKFVQQLQALGSMYQNRDTFLQPLKEAAQKAFTILKDLQALTPDDIINNSSIVAFTQILQKDISTITAIIDELSLIKPKINEMTHQSPTSLDISITMISTKLWDLKGYIDSTIANIQSTTDATMETIGQGKEIGAYKVKYSTDTIKERIELTQSFIQKTLDDFSAIINNGVLLLLQEVQGKQPETPPVVQPSSINILGAPAIYAGNTSAILGKLQPTTSTTIGNATYLSDNINTTSGLIRLTIPLSVNINTFFLQNPINQQIIPIGATTFSQYIVIPHQLILQALIPTLATIHVYSGTTQLKLDSIDFNNNSLIYSKPFADHSTKLLTILVNSIFGPLQFQMSMSPSPVTNQKEQFNIAFSTIAHMIQNPYPYMQAPATQQGGGAAAGAAPQGPAVDMQLLTSLISDVEEDVQPLLQFVSKLIEVKNGSQAQVDSLLTSPHVFEYMLSMARLIVTLKKLATLPLRSNPSGLAGTLNEKIDNLINNPEEVKTTLDGIKIWLQWILSEFHVVLPASKLHDVASTMENSLKKYDAGFSPGLIQSTEILVMNKIMNEVRQQRGDAYDPVALQKLESHFVRSMSNEAQRLNNAKLVHIINQFKDQSNALAMIAAALK